MRHSFGCCCYGGIHNFTISQYFRNLSVVDGLNTESPPSVFDIYRRKRSTFIMSVQCTQCFVRAISSHRLAEERVVTGQSWDEFCDTLKVGVALGDSKILGIISV